MVPVADPAFVELSLTTPAELLSRIYPNGRLSGVRVDGPVPAPLGSRVQLTVKVAEPLPRTFKVTGQIAWARHAHANLKDCFGIDFIPQDAAGRERLLRLANNEVSVEATRYQERIATSLPVKISHGGLTRSESLVDLSEGGAFVKTRMFLPIGTELEIDVRPPMSLTAISLKGRVTWHRREGDAPGMGIEFVGPSARDVERLQKLLGKISARA